MFNRFCSWVLIIVGLSDVELMNWTSKSVAMALTALGVWRNWTEKASGSCWLQGNSHYYGCCRSWIEVIPSQNDVQKLSLFVFICLVVVVLWLNVVISSVTFKMPDSSTFSFYNLLATILRAPWSVNFFSPLSRIVSAAMLSIVLFILLSPIACTLNHTLSSRFLLVLMER